MKNELYSFETVTTPGFYPSLVGRVAPRAPLLRVSPDDHVPTPLRATPVYPSQRWPCANTFPLPTIPTQHPKRAKKPAFMHVWRSKCTPFPHLSHSIFITRPLPKPILPYASQRWPCAGTFHFFHFFHSIQKEWKNGPYSWVLCAPDVSDFRNFPMVAVRG